MIAFRILIVLSCLSAGTLLSPEGVAAAPDRPHIILIVTDDMGYSDPSCYGGAGVATPGIDRLAREGTRFTQCYSGSPICSPSRTAILTGQYPGRHRITTFLQTRAGNIAANQNDFLDPPSAAVLPWSLKSAGYATAHFGKWHLGGGRDVHNAPSIREYGFDEVASTWESPEPHPKLGVEFAPWDHKTEAGQVPRHKRTAYLVNRTLDFLRRNGDGPCFVNLWPDDMHTPFRPSPKAARRHGIDPGENETSRRSFAATLEDYDRQIRRLLNGLRDLGIEKDTVVIFTSDNGPNPDLEGARTGGLRGSKASLYEGGIRVPFLVRWPGRVPAGKVNEKSVISGVDFALTLGRLGGVEFPESAIEDSDGQDMSAALLGQETTRTKALFWEFGRENVYKPRPRKADRSPNLAVRDGEWKLLINDDGTSRELYSMLRNPEESENVAARHPAVAEELAGQALAWGKTFPARSHDTQTTRTAVAPTDGGGAESTTATTDARTEKKIRRAAKRQPSAKAPAETAP